MSTVILTELSTQNIVKVQKEEVFTSVLITGAMLMLHHIATLTPGITRTIFSLNLGLCQNVDTHIGQNSNFLDPSIKLEILSCKPGHK